MHTLRSVKIHPISTTRSALTYFANMNRVSFKRRYHAAVSWSGKRLPLSSCTERLKLASSELLSTTPFVYTPSTGKDSTKTTTRFTRVAGQVAYFRSGMLCRAETDKEEQPSRKRVRSLIDSHNLNAANAITLARIVATPYLAYLIITGDMKSAFAVTVAAGVSDWLDGYIARTYNQQSVLGSFLDPFADKFLVGTVSVSMAYAGLLPTPLVALMLGRDAFLIGGSAMYRYTTKKSGTDFFDSTDQTLFQVKPSFISKANTTFQFMLLSFVITHGAWGWPSSDVNSALEWIVGTTTVLSGADYLVSFLRNRGALVLPRRKRKDSS